MYLKSIEVQGFKSFANKIKFEFNSGITGIVGPNGSGKSNVADAVRWVLGEQRVKQLRGSSMQDVIFTGTEQRKPLSYAYVAITLDNSDHALDIAYDEVTVARRLYRSGESEYLLNGTVCRLKDVNELFYDTGVGKEGYSIIGQGQIDRILSDKPEDRRELFDEAAGIVKYKRRKETAIRKLENEKANLVRISDILSELEKQVGPLEKQAEKARIYLNAREELKVLDVNMFLLENRKSREQIRETKEKADIAEKDLSASRTSLEKTKEDYEKEQNRLEDLEKEIEDTRSRITHTDIVRGKLEGDIKVYEEQIRSGKKNIEHFMTRQEAVADQIGKSREEQNGYEKQKKEIDTEIAGLQESRAKAAGGLEEIQKKLQTVSGEADHARETVLGLLNKRASIKSRMASLDTLEKETDIRKAELTSRLLNIRTDESRQEELIRELEQTFEKVSSEIGEMQDRQKLLEQEIALRKKELTESDASLQEIQQQYHRDRSRLEAIRNITERYEGFGGAVRKVMQYKRQETGLIGVVADLLKTEKKYETAIEVALGGNIQNIVTRDEGTAKRMIEVLKREKAGRSTFLPLSSLSDPQEWKGEILKSAGVLGVASDLVETEPQYRNVARFLLGRIVVVDTFDHASAIQKKGGASVRMVTLEGELFTPGGSISGGAYKNSSNLLGSRRELQDLEEKVAAADQKVRKLLQLIEEIKKKRNLQREETERLRMEIQSKFLEQNTARVNVVREKERKNEFSGNYESLREESESIEEKIRSIQEQKKHIASELEESEKIEESSNALIASSEKEIASLRREEEAASAEVSRWDMEIEKIRQKAGFHQENIDRIEHDLARFTAEETEIRETLQETRSELQEKTEQIARIKETIESSYTSQEGDDRKLKEAVQKREELIGKQRECFRQREELTEQIAALDKECYRLTAQLEALEEALEKQIGYMWDEYEITLSDAEALRTEEEHSPTEMKHRIQALKARIKELGSVNVNAIEEFREVQERYSFLKTQHDDLVKAEEALQEIITQLDTSMRKQFREQFAKIRSEFDKVFKVLFGGGQGQLELVEGEDLLEAGVRVIAQPPGKKLVNMMQLSGGEKSLAAIALLFAIQNLKPSPFCLLDEIEAALDESNVIRFADYLHRLTRNTQFIVITHRRGTMERSDRLYGITMQEKGVSTLVSVNLVDQELS